MKRKKKRTKAGKAKKHIRKHILMSGRKRNIRRKKQGKNRGVRPRKRAQGASQKRGYGPRIKMEPEVKEPYTSKAPKIIPIPPESIRAELITPLPVEGTISIGYAGWLYIILFIIASLGLFFLLPGGMADAGFFISISAIAVTAAVLAFAVIYAVKSRKKAGLPGYFALLLPVIISVFMAWHFHEETAAGGVHVGLLPVPLTIKPHPGFVHGKKYRYEKTVDTTQKYLNRIMKTASGSAIDGKKKEYFKDHVHILFRNTGNLACEGKTASECLAAWQKRGFPAIKELPQANSVTMQMIKDDNGVKISWAGNSPKLRLDNGNKLDKFCRPGNNDEKKKAAFASAADILITDKGIKKQVEEYYANPAVRVDTAGEVAPFYVYYLACLFIFEYDAEGQKSYSSYLPPPASGTAPDFLKMNEIFDKFMDKAAALDGLASLVADNAGKRPGEKKIKQARQAAGKISEEIHSEDMETAEHFITLALKSSLVARQWAVMENSMQKNPWFETTYDSILNRDLLGMFLETGIKPCKYTKQYEKFIAAAALMLYKTSRVMGTYKDNNKYMIYSDNYMIAHAILMHFMDEFDAALRESVAQELDRYYAGRYCGTVDY
jgi:hypothetical protein